MENTKQVRRTMRPDGDKKLINNKLSRIMGQVSGVQKMIEENRYCDEVLIQLSAINQAVKSLANFIIEKHMTNCVVKDIQSGNLETISEVAKLYRRFQ